MQQQSSVKVKMKPKGKVPEAGTAEVKVSGSTGMNKSYPWARMTPLCFNTERVVTDVAICWLYVHLSALSCAVSLSVNLFSSLFPVYLAERCALNGKVKVMLLTMCSQLMSCTRLHSEKDIII